MDSLLFQPDVAFDSARGASFQEAAGGYLDIPERQAQRVGMSRRLERLRSVAVFRCGSVITSVGPLGAFLTPAMAVVTPGEFVILPAEPGRDMEIEYGRIERTAVARADVFGADQQVVPEEVLHSEMELRPDVGGSFILMVSLVTDEPMTLVFRSAIEARRARDRFREWIVA
ncbi:MAG: hypothetical protein QOE83_2234 [Actinomycetota bacterium]|jgi:hypothetical protein|nr:hypothetical protein [Actinomycetota bacterium]